MNYYANQLNKLVTDDMLTIKVSGESGSTHCLTVNSESIPELIKFLESRLLKEARDNGNCILINKGE